MKDQRSISIVFSISFIPVAGNFVFRNILAEVFYALRTSFVLHAPASLSPLFNPFKGQINPLYIKIRSVPDREHSVRPLKKSLNCAVRNNHGFS
jgi:hypothetical protein